MLNSANEHNVSELSSDGSSRCCLPVDFEIDYSLSSTRPLVRGRLVSRMPSAFTCSILVRA